MLKKILPFILLLFLFFNSLFAGNIEGVKVVFRYDDFLLKPSPLNDSILIVFSKYKVPLCIGIVPFDTSGNFLNRLDSNQLSFLRSRISRGEVEVALHGFNHRNHLRPGRFAKPTYSEWAGVSYNEQLRKLSSGKKILDSVLCTEIKVFVPPFNTYDDNTLRALEDLGFEIISGNRQGSSNGRSIQFMPSTYEDFSSLPEIIKKNRDKDVSVIVYFHPYTFKGGSDSYSTSKEGNMSVADLDSLLSRLKTDNLPCFSFSGLAKTGSFNSASFRNNAMKFNLLKKALFYTKQFSYGTMRSSGSDSADNALTAGNILLHILVFFTVFTLAGFLLKIFHPGINSVILCLIICLMPVVAYLVYIRNDYSFGMIIIMMFVIFSALVSGIVKRYKDGTGFILETVK